MQIGDFARRAAQCRRAPSQLGFHRPALHDQRVLVVDPAGFLEADDADRLVLEPAQHPPRRREIETRTFGVRPLEVAPDFAGTAPRRRGAE